MSWNLDVTGHRAAVKTKVLAEQHIPPGVKQAIIETIDDATPTSSSFVRVTTFGHFGGGWSSIGKLEVQAVTVLTDDMPQPLPPSAPSS